MQLGFKKIWLVGSFLFLALSGLTLSKLPALAAIDFTAQGPDLGVKYPGYAGLSDVDPRITTAKLIRIALSVLGTVFLVIVLYGGFLWMTAGGNEDRVSDAKKWIASGVIGLAIILSAFGITTFVINNLTAASISGDATSI